MKEATIHLDERGHAQDIHFDGAEGVPISAFLLLTSVPADPPGCHMLTYGSSDLIGNALMTLFQRSVHEFPRLAWTLEQVARGIVTMADNERKEWPSDEKAGRA
ncbi:MAG: hypothetical protein M0Z38_06655 [Deltaproteobacteria bacterium]|nr:hypothetical protein [Deltaproteobacteria bacterium]